ncbi:major facilitator superfamily domain-containing protein [Achaetomium macrosporum]|uniref:Major facilitator superfamily domain-containing protein n=1 Tax=Achaetomium macrosporum TaxID=79813 RepID=A0AAN7C1T7_9PEZI|nr:major facilitator superfamily domain-containing protein [Achaetomium macrosporum]
MTETPSITLGEPEGVDTHHTRTRQWEGKRKRALVLVGSALLQLPIWGFAMTYGVFQEYYSSNWTLRGSQTVTGIIGTTANGVMYLSMPFLFALFTKRWAHHRQKAALCGAALASANFLLSSFSTHVWHLVATQGVLAALGCSLVYSPMTLSLGEWFNTSNRAMAYGVVLSCKNVVGSTCPFLVRALLDHYSFRVTLRAWAAITAGVGILAIFLVPTHPSSLSSARMNRGGPVIPWHFLRHRTIYIYSVATVLQSAGYGIPQTYLNTYAKEVTLLSETSATLLLTLFNIPGIASSSFFGYLSNTATTTDNSPTSFPFSLSATAVTAMSAIGSALSAWLFWGLTSSQRGSGMALLVLFSVSFGFFAGGYSATWGGVINELEREAVRHNEPVDTGMLYGLLNGARGIGYVSGGLVGVPLLKVGAAVGSGLTAVEGPRFGYGTSYGPLIIFTGLSSAFGGWGLLWKWTRLLHLL